MATLRIDLETYSDVDLKKCGVHKYVESDKFEVMLFAYAFDDKPVEVIDFANGEKIPYELSLKLYDPTVTKTAYNAAFEIACLNRILNAHLEREQWRCTSVHALYLGLPGNLGDVGKVLGLGADKQKLTSGWALIRYFCVPCKPTLKNGGRVRNLPHHDPDKWALFTEYCARDVESEREIANRISKFPVPDKEWALWHLDQRMMNKGVKVDRDLVSAAIECDGIFKERMNAEAIALTGLDNPNSRNQLLKWLQVEEDDDTIVDLTKKSVPKVLESTDSAIVRRVLELRQEMAKTSVSKYHAMSRAMCDKDDSVKGLTQFYGANRTGRWAGRLVQVQNLPQNKLRDIDLARNLLKARDYETLELLFGNVPDTLSQLIRTAFVAREGCRYLIVDFSAIEARVIAWMAWCQWRLDVFATHGKIYEASAEQMFHLEPGSVTKKSPYRQKGKISELALGYQGGAGALKTMGALEMGLKEEELEPIKEAWRAANPEIVQFWYACERSAKEAVMGKKLVSLPIAGKRASLVFDYESGFLTVQLPSKRKLYYVKPRIEIEDLLREKFVVARAGSLTYEGQDQKTKQWTRLSTYGGKLCIAQGSLVLAQRGWIEIEYITAVDKVWDGVEWVSTDGAVCNGAKKVIKAYGAWMTPDHKVLSEGGWIYASQSEGHNRAACGLPDGIEVPRKQWHKVFVGGGLRLWNRSGFGSDRAQQAKSAGRSGVMWVQEVRNNWQAPDPSRHEQASSVCGMAVNDGSLPATFTSSMGKLRREGYQRMRTLARIVREFLGGHENRVPAEAYVGQSGQRGQLRAGQLPVGDVQGAGQQSTTAKVYDLVNCGPRSRFVIWADGVPLIVHNCENITQAVARDCLAESMLALDAAGYTQLATVHDEIIMEANRWNDSCTLKEAEEIMGKAIDWAPGLPLRGDGFETNYYMKEID